MAGFRGIFRIGVTLAGLVRALRHTSAMEQPFLGTEALATGDVTPYQLRSRFVALHQDVRSVFRHGLGGSESRRRV
jgi:hypothetical protein